jgi:hypothetical protein
MSTVAEIVEAVRQLPHEQRRELLVQLEPVLFESLSQSSTANYFSANFTARLVEHFHRAKQAALASR